LTLTAEASSAAAASKSLTLSAALAGSLTTAAFSGFACRSPFLHKGFHGCPLFIIQLTVAVGVEASFYFGSASRSFCIVCAAASTAYAETPACLTTTGITASIALS
jgi:hypothetical protein